MCGAATTSVDHHGTPRLQAHRAEGHQGFPWAHVSSQPDGTTSLARRACIPTHRLTFCR